MTRRFPIRARNALAACVISLAFAGCGLDAKQDFPVEDPRQKDTPIYESELEGQSHSIFGEGGFDLFGLGGGGSKAAAGPGVAVNSYLWRASLDTIAFMPLASADPFGGVIITDWYTPPEAPRERYKMSVYILGRELRADGVRVAVFRQRAAGAGSWINGDISKNTAVQLENQILTRARQLRLAATKNR